MNRSGLRTHKGVSLRKTHMKFASIALLAVAFAATASPTLAQSTIDGLWAQSPRDCANDEGPDSKTFIDLKNRIKGKLTPIYDQYENHCIVDRVGEEGKNIRLSLTCYEFWEEFNARKNGRRVGVRISDVSAKGLSIDGRKYRMCKRQAGVPRS